jgi:phage tail sheath gpL-like
MATSTAIQQDAISPVLGYKLKKANFRTETPDLPQRIVLFGQGNTADQSGFDETHFPFTTAKEVGDRFGYGSELYLMARILRPVNANRLGGIETIIMPQLEAGGATAGIYKLGITVASTVTANVKHVLYVNGRDRVDGSSYIVDLKIGDDQATVQQKFVDAIANVLGSPVTAAINVGDVDFTTKWKGATAKLNIRVDVGKNAAGVVYAETSNVAGTGDPDLTNTLANFGDEWNTIVINPYGSTQLTALEDHNGVPDPDNPTGRYQAEIFKPYVALFGSLESTTANILAITDIAARKSQVTNVLCPAPNSEGFEFEAAANMCVTCAKIFDETPHLGNLKQSYPDMPIPADNDIGDFSEFPNRDLMAKGGSSTVLLAAGQYQVMDFLTTYHPEGEVPAKFNEVRDLNVNWNIAFGWKIKQETDIQGKVIVGDDQQVNVDDTVSPKQGKQLIFSYADDIARKAFIADTDFTKESTVVNVNENNPARLDTFFRTKITSVAKQVSSDVEFDFNF